MSYPASNLIPCNTGGFSARIAISTSSAQSAAYDSANPVYLNVYTDVDCFVRSGLNPTALSTGVDQIIPSGPIYRLGPVPKGHKLAFVTASGSGFVYLTPEN